MLVDSVQETFKLQRAGERELDLQAGLLAADDLADPLTRDEVHDRHDIRAAATRELRRIVDPDRMALICSPFGERRAF